MKKYLTAIALLLIVTACSTAPKDRNSTRFNVDDTTSSSGSTENNDNLQDYPAENDLIDQTGY